MKRFRNLRLPSAAMIVAVVALVFAFAGGAVAAKKLSLGVLSDGAKNKTVGVGKLTYVTTPTSVPTTPGATLQLVRASCPPGLKAIGGGVKLEPHDDSVWWADGYLTTTGYSSYVNNSLVPPATATVTVACANSRAVTGAPPTS